MKEIKQKKFQLKISFKINARIILRVVWLFAIATGLAAFSYVSFFLHQKVYNTIIQAEEIQVLRGKVATETMDIKTLEKIIQNIEAKESITEINWQEINDPFLN